MFFVDKQHLINTLDNLNANDLYSFVRRCKLNDVKHWIYDNNVYHHQSNKFFTAYFVPNAPLKIIQYGIGLLGLAFYEFNRKKYCLVQLKAEPGNLPFYQIAPTVQATQSNIECVHKGKRQKYLELFDNLAESKLSIKMLEYSDVFQYKCNNNVVVQTKNHIKLHKNFYWISLTELYELCKTNYVNPELRSILTLFLLKQFTIDCFSRKICLDNRICANVSKCIKQTDDAFISEKYSIVGLYSRIQGRELDDWYQPIIVTHKSSKYVLLKWNNFYGISIYNNMLDVKDDLEIQVEIDKKHIKTLVDFSQSCEGGRFYRSVNNYRIIQTKDKIKSATYLTLNEIAYLVFVERFIISTHLRNILCCVLNV